MDLQPEPRLAQRLADRLYVLIVRRDPDFPEVLSGVVMLLWGVQLVLPWDTFTTGLGYAAMAELLPEPVWGLVLAWIGVTQVGSYLLDQWRVRLASSLGALMAWTFLTVLFGASNPVGTGVIVYGGFAGMSAWVFWRVLIAGPSA